VRQFDVKPKHRGSVFCEIGFRMGFFNLLV
jgi:hypothetical protein